MTAVDKIDLSNLDRLPWLESVEPEDEDNGEPGVLRQVLLVIVGLLLLAGIVFGIYKMQQHAR